MSPFKRTCGEIFIVETEKFFIFANSKYFVDELFKICVFWA